MSNAMRGEANRKYRAAHQEQIREYCMAHLEEKRKRDREYHAVHREEKREYHRKWREAHPEYKREYYATHREEECERSRNNRQAYPEYGHEYFGKWRATERGKAVVAAMHHRRRVKLSDTRLTADTILDLKAESMGFCPYCNKRIVKGHVDHIVPVSKGGMNDRMNLVWACQTCNEQKHSKSLLAFMLYRRNLAERVEGSPNES